MKKLLALFLAALLVLTAMTALSSCAKITDGDEDGNQEQQDAPISEEERIFNSVKAAVKATSEYAGAFKANMTYSIDYAGAMSSNMTMSATMNDKLETVSTVSSNVTWGSTNHSSVTTGKTYLVGNDMLRYTAEEGQTPELITLNAVDLLEATGDSNVDSLINEYGDFEFSMTYAQMQDALNYAKATELKPKSENLTGMLVYEATPSKNADGNDCFDVHCLVRYDLVDETGKETGGYEAVNTYTTYVAKDGKLISMKVESTQTTQQAPAGDAEKPEAKVNMIRMEINLSYEFDQAAFDAVVVPAELEATPAESVAMPEMAFISYYGDTDYVSMTPGMTDPAAWLTALKAEGVEGLTNVKYYTDEDCTKELDFTGKTLAEAVLIARNNIYVAGMPDEGYALVQSTAKGNLASFNQNYLQWAGLTKLDTVLDTAKSASLVQVYGEPEWDVYYADMISDESIITGITVNGQAYDADNGFTVESGMIYNVEYTVNLSFCDLHLIDSEENMIEAMSPETKDE